ncbi:MAG: DUF364 domain-containing protein [Deltaproteobacteria bacterium]|nr:DUF364 domain-containing protein [Deltaproteobacteria bacterium]
MEILSSLISSIKEDYRIHQILTGVHWTAVVSKYCGLSSTFQDPPPHRTVKDVGSLAKKSALELVEYAKSDNQLEASIGMAALNSLIEINEKQCVELNAFNILAEKGKHKNVAIVGHFPFIPKLRKLARTLWVLEMNPRPGDSHAEEAEDILPQADVVGITGTSFINHTIDGLLGLCKKDSWVMMVGATSPLSTILFDYGVDMIAGSKVIDPQKAIGCISQGATFRQIEGIKHLIMKK